MAKTTIKKSRQKAISVFNLCMVTVYGILFLAINQYSLSFIFPPSRLQQYTAFLLIWGLLMLLLGVFSFAYKRQEEIARINLIIFSIIFVFTIAEICLRLTSPRISPEEVLLRIKDPNTHHALAPNMNVSTGGFRGNIVHYKTNNLGYRCLIDEKVSRKSQSDNRILLLGDSFTEGVGLDYKDTFAYQLTCLLNGRGGKSFEILNSAVCSYSPKLEARKLSMFLKRGFKANQVLLFLDISDVQDEYSYLTWNSFTMEEMERWRRTKSQDYKRRLASFSEPELYPLFLVKFSESLKNLTTHFINPDDASSYIPRRNQRYSWTVNPKIAELNPWIQTGFRELKKNISRIRTLCEDNAIRFAIVIYPTPYQLNEPCRSCMFRKRMKDFSNKEKLTLIDLYPIFYNLKNFANYFFSADVHWNKNGHALVGESLYNIRHEWLEKEGMRSSD